MSCSECGVEIDEIMSFKGRCAKCHAVFLEASAKGLTVDELHQQQSSAESEREARRPLPYDPRGSDSEIAAVILTTESASDLNIQKRISVVGAEVVVGMNIVKDILAGVRNIVGGRSGTVQSALRDIRRQALDELKAEARRVGADAVVGVTLGYQDIGATGSTMLLVAATGTAVKLGE